MGSQPLVYFMEQIRGFKLEDPEPFREKPFAWSFRNTAVREVANGNSNVVNSLLHLPVISSLYHVFACWLPRDIEKGGKKVISDNAAQTVDNNKTSPWQRYKEAALGFRNYWYPALLSRKLRKKPIAIKILGERLFFIRYKGKCYAMEDRCAHRGVPLSAGRCEFPGTSTISCPYHGWVYDITNGQCVGALTDGPDSPIVGKVRLTTYPVEERKGLIWVFIGDGESSALVEDVPEELLHGTAVVEIRVTQRPGNWRLAAENGIDPSHAAYLHRHAALSFFR